MQEHAALTQILRSTLKQARAVLQWPTLCPELGLFLLNQDFPRSPLSAQEQRAVFERTAFWAFCWPAGQVLARLILDHPGWVKGLTVLDLGCGSGVAGLAAARAGASRVVACDRDLDALSAARANAQANGLALEVRQEWQWDERFDLVLLADLLYDRDNLPLLRQLQARNRAILAADCRVFEVPVAWRDEGRYASAVVPDLDWHDEFRWVQVFSRGIKRL